GGGASDAGGGGAGGGGAPGQARCDLSTPCPAGQACAAGGFCYLDCGADAGVCADGQTCAATAPYCPGSACDAGNVNVCVTVGPPIR
ncbi:MAG TPA: hypothetical protein VHO06_07245, partial [Polyangia bacterium]|nr:hypothetical protein [Polyangia bacterium]